MTRRVSRSKGWLATLNTVANHTLAGAAAICLLAMMLITLVDVVLRIFGMQIAGSFELVGWLAAASMGLSLGYVQRYKGHVSVTILSERFRGRAAWTIQLLHTLLSFALIATLAVIMVRVALLQKLAGSLSETLRMPVYPWVLVLAAGLFAFSLSLMADHVEALHKLFNPEGDTDTAHQQQDSA